MASPRTKTGLRPSHLAAGIALLAVPGTAVALAATPPAAAQATHSAPLTAFPAPAAAGIKSIQPHAAHIGYADRLTVTGVGTPGSAGERVELQLRTAATDGWQTVDEALVGRRGRFSLATPMRRSGLIRVIGHSHPATSSVTTVPDQSRRTAVSGTRRITVAPKLDVAARAHGVLSDQTVAILGTLRPGVRGRRVALQTRHHGTWTNLTSTRTNRDGAFRLRYVPSALGAEPLRVSFAGDETNTAATAAAGQLTVFHTAVASWYEDGGATACGFHAYYGVANLSLPCGTKVTLRRGSRTVVATVDDRGPYVGGRTYDLNQNTAEALGFGGVGVIWASA